MKFLFKCWLLFGLISCSGLSGLAVEFEVEGTATYDLFSGKYLDISTTNHFIVSVRGAEWGITTWTLGNTNRIFCYKDTNYLRTVVTTFFGGTNSSKAWLGTAFVEHLDRPSTENQFLQTLWLTYCSATYLQSITDGKIEPIWRLDNPLLHKQGFTLPAKWTLNELPPHLPSELCYLSDGLYHGYNYDEKKPKEIKLRVPYDTGYTCAVFRAASTTNLIGISIPTEFYFETSQTPLGGRTPDMPRDEMFGVVESVKAHTDVERFLPPYQGEITIHDATEKGKLPPNSVNSNYMIYKGHDGDWPRDEKLKTLEYKRIRNAVIVKTERDKLVIKEKLAHNDGKRRIVLSFFLLATLTPLFIFLWKILGKRGP